MSNIKKTLLEGVEIKQSPAIVEFLEWYEDNSILTEEEAQGTDGSIIEQDTIEAIVSFFHDNKHYDEIASESTLVDVFAKVLDKMVDDSVYNAFQAVTEFAEAYDCSINDIADVESALTELSNEDLDEATKYYGAFQTLSDTKTIDALEKIAAVVASPELDSLLTEMTNGSGPSKISAYVEGSEDEDQEESYQDSYDRIGLDDDTLTAIMDVASIISENKSISITDLYVKILQDEKIHTGLLDEDGDATFSDEDVTNIMNEFSAVEINESIEDSISRGLAKLQEQSKHLSRATKKKIFQISKNGKVVAEAEGLDEDNAINTALSLGKIDGKKYTNLQAYCVSNNLKINASGLTAKFVSSRGIAEAKQVSMSDEQNHMLTIIMSAITQPMVETVVRTKLSVKVILKPEHRYIAQNITIKKVTDNGYTIVVNKIKRNNKTVVTIEKGSEKDPIIGVNLPQTLTKALQ